MGKSIKIILLVSLFSMSTAPAKVFAQGIKTDKDIKVGASRFELYLGLMQGKRIAVVANQTSQIGGVHLVDTLISLGVNVRKVFAPEHGFRGVADAGEHVRSGVDKKTGLRIISLYGNHKKPQTADLADVDVVVFDIQDVGVRFYTYISTMHYVMEACAENDKRIIVLDRPNPNGFYVDGPILESKYTSFVGLHPIPVVHGLTIAELATMINEEHWLKGGARCSLTTVLCDGYRHGDFYHLPVKPSPNLPNMASIYLYPSLGLFEGTVVSVGRGTEWPFQVIGHPEFTGGDFQFVPKSTEGAKEPPHKNVPCNGFDLRTVSDSLVATGKISIDWMRIMYRGTKDKQGFFLASGFLSNLIGNKEFQGQMVRGDSDELIRASWQPRLTEYQILRKKYLLYPDFE